MGMFRRKNVSPLADPVFGDDELKRVTAVWRLTALPREEFDATYGDLLRRARRTCCPASRRPRTLRGWPR